MKLNIIEMPFGKRSNEYQPDKAMYKHLGESGIRRMVDEHYNLLVDSPIKHLFPKKGPDLEEAKKRSADFLVQRLGGPEYYEKNRGKPMLSRRHAPFKITPEARIIWLECYRQVLLTQEVPEEIIQDFWNWLNELSNWMVNTPQSFDGWSVDK